MRPIALDSPSEGAVVPGARLPVQQAAEDALAGRAGAVRAVLEKSDPAVDGFVRDSGTALGRAGDRAGTAISSAGGELRLAFDDVEAMTGTVTVLAHAVAELAASTAGLALDGDLLASLPLSPGTGVAAEAALGTAAGGLSASALQASALAVSTGVVVSSFAAADAWLAAAAGSLGAAGDATVSVAGAGASLVGSVAGAAAEFAASNVHADAALAASSLETAGDLASAAFLCPALVVGGAAAVAVGFGSETLRTLGAAFDDASRAFGSDPSNLNPFRVDGQLGFGVALAAGFDHHFSLDRALSGAVTGIQAILGATGPFYDDILAGLVTTGYAFGLFHDGDVTVRPAGELDHGALRRSLEESATALGIDNSTGFQTMDGRIVPDGWGSMMAGLSQLDDVGGTERAIIRIFTVLDEDGSIAGYRVQIPSTASWNPSAQPYGTPGDLTSDVYSMFSGSDAALASSVYEAMRQAGIQTGPGAPPVEIDGFSLGGITAAAIAADPRGFNVTEIHTAGSPIGGMKIDDGIRVFSLEAEQDLVTALDGQPNPERQAWVTVRGTGVPTRDSGEMPTMWPGTVHDSRRYSVMGSEHEVLESVGALRIPVGGTVLVNEYEARREGQP